MQEEKLNYKSSRVIDYSNSKFQSDFMDLYLLSKCNFYLGSDSGIGNVSVISNRYIGLCNSTYFHNLQVQNFKRVVIFKKYYSRKLKRFLSLNEIFENEIHKFSLKSEFENQNINIIDNSEDEISNLAIEIDSILSNKYFISENDLKYHTEFWNIIKKYGVNPKNNYNEIRVSNYFLKNNLYLLK